MITREEAVAYLDRVTEARKTLNIPLNPELCVWHEDNAYYLFHDESKLPIENAKKLAEVIGHPYRLSYFGQDCDKLSFRYNGIEVYTLVNHGCPRIGKNECSGLSGRKEG